MRTPPTNKAQFYALYENGSFGNRARTWPNAASLAASGHSGLVVARSLVAGGPCYYRLPVEQAVKMEGMRFNESMPDANLLIQGEVVRSFCGLRLCYQSIPGQMMREAIGDGVRHADGIVAKEILRAHLWPASYDDLMELLDDFDCVVEFGCYSVAVGDRLRRNTVFWEVRNY